jgi:succinate dehydrogenase/fumarate reductase flavoprotein subunit
VDSVDEHLADIHRISRGTARADLVRRAVEHAPAVVDWLAAHGFEFDPSTPRIVYGHEPYSVPRTHIGRDGGMSILAALAPLLEEALRTRTLELWTSTAVTGLTVGATGAVTGVEVWGSHGEQRIAAGAVVLATGGFAADADVFEDVEGVPLVSAAHPTATGDGLLLARSVGAAVAGRGTYLPTFGGLPHPTTPGRAQWSDRVVVASLERPPWEVYVDRRGRRFVAEDEPSIDEKERALSRLPDLTFWMVLDDRGRRESVPVVGWSPQDVDERAGRRRGVHRADTLADLAELAGIDADGLLREVTDYNDALRRGDGDRLGRVFRPAPVQEPPFYALENHGISLISFAGVDVDVDLRVRHEDGSVVPGLFAVGEVLGAGATCGNSFCSGMLVTPALALGCWLGRRLAESAPLVLSGS